MRRLPPETDSDNRIVIRYGLELFILKVLFISVIFILSLVVGCFVETLIFMVLFVPLRESAGGFHSQSRIACFIESLCLVGLVLIVVKIPVLRTLYIEHIVAGAAIVAAAVIIIFAPVDNADKRLTNEEQGIQRRKTRIILAVEVVILAVLYTLTHTHPGEFITTSFLCAALAVFASGGLVGFELIRRVKFPEEDE
jgi:accessory gene regulator B